MATKTKIDGILSGIQKVLDAANEIAPVAAALGGPVVANAATMVIAATAVVENVLARVGDTSVAMTTQDEEKLKAMLGELQNANDKLAGVINDS